MIIVAFVTFILDVLWGDEPEASTRGFTLGMATMVGAFIVCEKLPQKKRELRYPPTEYTLEYKLITKGEQVDSVYVATEKIEWEE